MFEIAPCLHGGGSEEFLCNPASRITSGRGAVSTQTIADGLVLLAEKLVNPFLLPQWMATLAQRARRVECNDGEASALVSELFAEVEARKNSIQSNESAAFTVLVMQVWAKSAVVWPEYALPTLTAMMSNIVNLGVALGASPREMRRRVCAFLDAVQHGSATLE